MFSHVSGPPNAVYEHVYATSRDQISSTVATVMADYLKTPERTVFWDDNLKRNVDPFQSLEGGFFAADWDLKVPRSLLLLR